MKNINKKSINFGLKALTIFAFVFIIAPFNKASAYSYITGCGEGGCNEVWGATSQPAYQAPVNYMPPYQQPVYTQPPYQQQPIYNQQQTNVYNQPYQQTPPCYNTQPCYQQPAYSQNYQQPLYYSTPTVYSNEGSYKPKTRVMVKHVYDNPPARSYNPIDPPAQNNISNTTSPSTSNSNYNNELASNAIFGSNSFLPSGLIQWLMFAIVILLIVVLARKVFGTKDEYHSTPLKHE